MKCKAIQNRLNAYLDNEVDAKTRSIIQKHLLTCHECQSELSQLKALNYQLNISFTEELNPQIIRELTERSRFIQPQRKKFAQLIMTAATMCMAVFLGAYISNVSFEQKTSVTAVNNTNNNSTTSYYDQQSLYAVLEEVSQ